MIGEILGYIGAVLGFFGGGSALLFYASKRKSAAAKGRTDEVSADVAENAAYNKRIENLSGQVDDLSDKIATVRKQFSDAQDEITNSVKVIGELKINRAKMGEQLAILESENAALSTKNEILAEQVASLRQKNAELEKKNSILKAQLARLEKENAEALAELMRLKEKEI